MHNVKWEAKILILQLKLGISHIKYNGKCCRLRKLEYLYDKVKDTICNLCGRAEEAVFHIITECCHYSGPRRQDWAIYYVTLHLLEITTYLSLFNNLSELEVSNISKFSLVACKIRMFSYSKMGIDLG